MSKEMTPKESLVKLCDRANHDEYLFRKNTNVERANEFLDENTSLKDCINQALDRLELLEKENSNQSNLIESLNRLIIKAKQENQEIEKLYLNENKHWCETIDSLRKENQDLKFDNELICKLAYDRQVENEKLKKIIEIIINKRINVVFFKACKDIKEANIYRSKENKLTQQEYDLLKEVLE